MNLRRFAVGSKHPVKEGDNLTIEEITGKIVEILDSKKAVDVNVIDVEGKTILADRFVVATGTSVTHIKSLAGEVEFQMKDKYGIVPDHVEGYETGRWVLLDYDDVVVHVFHEEERDFYSLEKLWQHSRA
ncbi:MAG: ribosome silencing factor [Clostridiaceae bacterium]|nr:ribosome silencing factor [Clostridiaceae bacterium]